MVFVINKNKKPLSPCSNAVARKLLNDKKATIHKMYPFTLMCEKPTPLGVGWIALNT